MKSQIEYPVIDLKKTGENIRQLRISRGLSVNEVREFLGFSEPQAVYQWQKGVSLPSVDHLCALSKLLAVPMDDILVLKNPNKTEQSGSKSGFGQRVESLVTNLVFLAA